MTTLKDLKNGDFFKTNESGKSVYQKGDYNRFAKKYECTNWINGNNVSFKGAKEVFVNFEF